MDTRFAYRDGALASATVTDNTGALLYKNTFIYGPSGEPLELIRTDPTSTRRFWYVLDGLGLSFSRPLETLVMENVMYRRLILREE